MVIRHREYASRQNVGSPEVIAQSQITPDNVLQQSNGLGFHQLSDHIAQYGSNCVEPLICMTDVGQASFIEQDLLDNEDGDSLGELRSSLHDA